MTIEIPQYLKLLLNHDGEKIKFYPYEFDDVYYIDCWFIAKQFNSLNADFNQDINIKLLSIDYLDSVIDTLSNLNKFEFLNGEIFYLSNAKVIPILNNQSEQTIKSATAKLSNAIVKNTYEYSDFEFNILDLKDYIPPVLAIGSICLASSQNSEHNLHLVKRNGNLIASHSIGSDVYYNGTSALGGVQTVFDTRNKAGYFVWRNVATIATHRIIKIDSSGVVSSELNIVGLVAPSRIPGVALSKDGTKLYCYYQDTSFWKLAIIDTSTMTISSTTTTSYTSGGGDNFQRLLVSADGFLYRKSKANTIAKFNEDFSTQYVSNSGTVMQDITLAHDSTLPDLFIRDADEIYKDVDNGSSFSGSSAIVTGLMIFNGRAELINYDGKLITMNPTNAITNNIIMYDLTGTLIYNTGNLFDHDIESPRGLNVYSDELYFTGYDNVNLEWNIYKAALTATTIGTPEVFKNGVGQFNVGNDSFGYNFDKITNAS